MSNVNVLNPILHVHVITSFTTKQLYEAEMKLKSAKMEVYLYCIRNNSCKCRKYLKSIASNANVINPILHVFSFFYN